MIVYMEIECIIYGAQSLKEKRSVIKSIIDRTHRHFNVSMSEIDFQNVWQRTKLAAVLVTNEYTHGEQIMQQVVKLVDRMPEIERTITYIDRI